MRGVVHSSALLLIMCNPCLCFSLLVPPPTLSIALLDDPISGTVVRLLGRVQVMATAIDTPVTLSGRWFRPNSDILSDSVTSNQSSPTDTFLTFNPLRVASKDGGDYVYTVTITPQDSTYIASASSKASYTLTVLPYPELVIEKSIVKSACTTTSLIGNVVLLLNTANNTLTHVWTDPTGRPIKSSTSDIIDGSLEVRNEKEHMGDYALTVCLDIPGSSIEGHCSTVSYSIEYTQSKYKNNSSYSCRGPRILGGGQVRRGGIFFVNSGRGGGGLVAMEF